jgi:hypothetical protein
MCFGLDKFTAHRLFEDDIADEGFLDEATVDMTLNLSGFWGSRRAAVILV